MLKIGQRNQLVVKEIFPLAYSLTALKGDDESEVQLKDTDITLTQGQKVDAFVYTLADGSLAASLASPKAEAGQFAAMVLMGASTHGYFFDWGIKPDLYMPETQAHTDLDIGSTYVVRVVFDKAGKVIGTTKIERFLEDDGSDLTSQQQVDLLIYGQTPLGYKAIVNNRYQGLLYKSDLITSISIGQSLSGYIKHIRDDGKLDLSLQLQNQDTRTSLSQAIIDDLEAHDGMSTLTDKSSPEEIFARFKVSKAAYKKAIGSLYKSRKIRIEKNCLYLQQ